MRFTAVGDFLVQRRLPGAYDGFQDISAYIKKGDMRFFNLETTLHLGDRTSRETTIHETDMKRVEKAIFEAQLQADYIVISFHSHEIQGVNKEVPDDFAKMFAHRCIDAGAHAIVGHGPHLLRPIESYKQRPIFYSLGDFVLHNENIPYAPEDFFAKHGLNSDATVHDLFKLRSGNFTRGLQTKSEMFESVIPYWEMANGIIKVKV